MPCVVRNISRGGALLEFTRTPRWLPYVFRLSIVAPAVEIECELRHLGSYGVGVMFAGAPARDAVADATILETARFIEAEAWGGADPQRLPLSGRRADSRNCAKPDAPADEPRT